MSRQDEINRRYTDEMNRLLGPDAPAAAAAAVARRRRERGDDREYDGRHHGSRDHPSGGHGQQHNGNNLGAFPPYASAGREGGPPPLDDLEIRRNDTGLVSGLTGMGSAREAMMVKRRREHQRMEGMTSRGGNGRRDMERYDRMRERVDVDDRYEFSGFLDLEETGGDRGEVHRSARKRRSQSLSPSNHRENRRNYEREHRSTRRRRRRLRNYSSSHSRSLSRSRSRSHSDPRGDGHRRRRRRRENHARDSSRDRRDHSSNNRDDRRRRRRRRRNRSAERSNSPGDDGNNRRNNRNNPQNHRDGRNHRDDRRQADEEEQNVVSEDSDPYLLKHAASRIADQADLADKADASSAEKKKPSRRYDQRDRGSDKKKRHRHRSRRHYSSSESSHSSSSSRSQSPSSERPYNPAPPGMMGYHNYSGSSPFQRSRSNNVARSSRKRTGKRRRKRNGRSRSASSDFSRERRGKRRRGRRDYDDEDDSYFSDDQSASVSSNARGGRGKQEKYHGRSRHGSNRDFQRRQQHFSRSRSFDENGRSYENLKRPSNKDKKRKAKKHHDGGNRSDASSKDDTVGHFNGGPGTIVDHRYRIIRDVGLGTFGRVVQCENLRHRASSGRDGAGGGTPGSSRRSHSRHYGGGDRYGDNERNNDSTVAIKIVRSVRRYHESAVIEADICERVNRESSRQNKDLCARMLDRFSLPSGHYCLVFECLGCSLYDFLKGHDYQPFPLYCVRDFSRQLLEALDFLHGFGLIHTDLKPENILLSSNEETTYRSWDGSTVRVPVRTKVKVIDFGGATFDDEKKSSIVNTRQYRAPEVILGWGWSYPSDLWSAGCIIAELYAGELLFATHDNAEHLALMERACGPFRKDLLDISKSPLARDCFDSRGWHRIRGVLPNRSIEHVRKMVPLERMVSEHDRPTGLGRLLRALLTIDPKRRATARDALMTPFFTQPR